MTDGANRDKGNGIASLDAIKNMLGGWDGAPRTPPDIMIRAWWIDPYWYVSSTDGKRLVMSRDEILTHEDLQWCVGEHVRLLFLDIPENPEQKEEGES